MSHVRHSQDVPREGIAVGGRDRSRLLLEINAAMISHAELPELLKTSMKLHFVEEMDQVLQIALEEKLPELHEETPSALGTVVPSDIDVSQPVAHQ